MKALSGSTYKARNFLTGETVTSTSLEKLGKLISSTTVVTIKRAMARNILTPAGWQVTRSNHEWLPITVDATTVVRCGSWVVKSTDKSRPDICAKTIDELVVKINEAYPDEYITDRVLSHRFNSGRPTRNGWSIAAVWGTYVVRQRKRFDEKVLHSPEQNTHPKRNTGKAFMLALEYLLKH